MNERLEYKEYLEKRGKFFLTDLLCKILLFINSNIVFYSPARIWIYKFLGVKIQENVYVAREVMFDDNFPEMITIDDGAVVSWRVIIICHDATDESNKYVAPVIIKEKAVIGAGSIVMPGVVIGEHSIVGAGSLVKHDVQPYSIVAGVPAKLIRTRKIDFS